MIFAHKKYPHVQTVGEWETVRISLLKRAGWYEAERVEPVAEESPAEPVFLNEASGLEPTPLPADFPGYAALHAAKIRTYAALNEYQGDLTDIPGIGKATAEKIHAAIHSD